MIYQKLHIGDPPYLIGSRANAGYPVHKHPEVELYYCVGGKYDIIINKNKYKVSQGQLAIVASMASHEVLDSFETPESAAVVIEIGHTMLGDYFETLKNQDFSEPIFDLNSEEHSELRSLLEETAKLHGNMTPISKLLMMGNIYKISAHIISDFITENDNSNATKKINSITAIEKALEHIYNCYDQKLTVDEAAEICGYSKSNFCKIFKNITGDTFHNVLNSHRVKVACTLLKNSDFSVEEIATRVGISSAKGFCRIFKEIKGMSPGTYRRKNRQ